MIAVNTARPAGIARLRFTLSKEVLRHASKGPIAVRNRRNSPIGTTTLLKNGGPTVTVCPWTASEIFGKRVPHKTANVAARRTRLLKRKLDSRETSDSSLFSL